jgi:PAS domain S-box-containing protein
VLQTFYFDYAFRPLRDETGAVYAIMCMAVDVTGQVLARQEIEESARRFRTLLETIPTMAWTNTPGGEVDFYNQRWFDYTGLTFDQTRDQGWQAVLHPDDLTPTLTNYQHALTTGTEFRVENRFRRADGTYRWHLTQALPIRDEDPDGNLGPIVRWVGTATDIEAQKQQEAELDRQVQARTEQLNTMILDLERSNQSLQQFAYVASHDLQEPLRKIQSFGDILKNQYGDRLDEGADLLARMQSASARMSALIRDLLAYSRISTQPETTEAVSLPDVVQTVLTDLELVIAETGASVIVDGLPTVPGDRLQLGQLVQNLVSNALKFRRPGVSPVVRVTARTVAATDLPPNVRPARVAEAYYQMDVADNGIGFDEKYADRIFQVFQRLHGRNEYAGTGIGLAICEKVAANHGGAIMAHSQPGAGASFSVYLPV